MTNTKQPRNGPLTLELKGYQVDFLADWARIDGEYMRTTGLDRAAEQRLANRRETLSLALAACLLPTLQEVDPPATWPPRSVSVAKGTTTTVPRIPKPKRSPRHDRDF